MAALAGQQRPGTADAGAVERAAVFVLAIAVAVVAAIGGTLRRLHLEQPFGDLERVLDPGIVGVAQPQANEVEVLHADQGRGQHRLAPAVLHFDASAQVLVRARGADAHVVAVDGVLRGEGGHVRSRSRPRSARSSSRPGTGIIPLLVLEEPGGGNQRHDLDAQGEGADAGVFLPSILQADRTVVGEIAYGAADHGLDAAHSRKGVFLHELAGENDRKSHLVELDSGPVGTAVREAVLVPPSVIGLGGDEIGQHPSRIVDLAHGHQGEPRFDAIARPHQVVAARGVARLSPRYAQAGDDRPRKGPVLVHLEDER